MRDKQMKQNPDKYALQTIKITKEKVSWQENPFNFQVKCHCKRAEQI